MFKKKKNQTVAKPTVDDLIDGVCTQIDDNGDYHSDETTKMVDNLDKLADVKVKLTNPRLSPDAIVAVGANLAGILLILKFEKLDILTSKAISFVTKSRF